MVAQTATPSIIAPGDEIFYVFPPNGFRVLYNTQIDDYFDYINTLDNIIADSPDVNEDIVKDVIGDAYTETDLTNAFKNGSDVLIYNISYYYAIRESLLQNVIDK